MTVPAPTPPIEQPTEAPAYSIDARTMTITEHPANKLWASRSEAATALSRFFFGRLQRSKRGYVPLGDRLYLCKQAAVNDFLVQVLGRPPLNPEQTDVNASMYWLYSGYGLPRPTSPEQLAKYFEVKTSPPQAKLYGAFLFHTNGGISKLASSPVYQDMLDSIGAAYLDENPEAIADTTFFINLHRSAELTGEAGVYRIVDSAQVEAAPGDGYVDGKFTIEAADETGGKEKIVWRPAITKRPQ